MSLANFIRSKSIDYQLKLMNNYGWGDQTVLLSIRFRLINDQCALLDE